MFTLLATRLTAVERWADTKLTVTNGLQMWLDASRQLDARQQLNLRPLPDGSRVDCWLDGSGHRRDVSQLQRESTPQLRMGAGVAWISFDGQNDFLAANRLGLAFSNATLFVVAAPKSNAGFFRGLFACAQTSQNDYTRGLNVDLGPLGGARFDYLNIESAGAGGARNFLKTGVSFGSFHVLAVQVGTGPSGIKTWLDGQLHGSRERAASLIRADDLVIGGRLYSNTADLPHAQGFLEGRIAEVLLYDRTFSEAEREQVTAYLTRKYAALRASDSTLAGGFDPLMPVEQPPAAQMFVPGFVTRELPVKLPNINVVKYRPDGKLMALGYNGQIYLLSDSDGDGLEDKVVTFWGTNSLRSPIGMALTPPRYSRGQGAFIPAKGRLALVVDTDGDDKADQDITVAEGWRELVHSVDSMGVAVDKEGNIYFGLGVENFTNPYLVEPNGKSRFDLKTERGTILKVSADFKKREVIATGVRFSVALAFNSQGDLFCTDQEGATWLSNGNPFDELLHIQTGRHYGFPPRHPKYLPNVIDEPSTFDYAPQHQSTCGLNFNHTESGRIFGPAWWAEDAFVSGYSRGKLYRTKLVNTEAGYVAENQLIASLNMLTVDAVVSPRGDLIVATHSGQPDWGSGPNGQGKLYQIRYEGNELPQPVCVWAESPTETAIAWDRPLTADQARSIARTCSLVAGKYVAAGDRFEALRPGYQVVQDQMREPRTKVDVYGTQLSPDGRLLTIRSQARIHAQHYAIALGAPSVKPAAGAKPLLQHTNIDLACSLNGVQVSGRISAAEKEWTAWMPSFDSLVSKVLLRPTSVGEQLEKRMNSQGTLTFRAQLNLGQMLRPAVQPGSKIDYTWPREEVFLRFKAGHSFTVQVENRSHTSEAQPGGEHMAVVKQMPAPNKWVPVELQVTKGEGDLRLGLTWHTAEDQRERPFALHRMLLPWATQQEPPAIKEQKELPELAGANWLNGRRIFFGETAGCYKCHQIRGEGHKVGPDLSNLVHRDYASVLKDILEPNAALNPDHIAYEAELKDGESITAVLQTETEDSVLLAAAGVPPMRLPKKQIQSMKPSGRSLMPEGLGQALQGPALKDLMAFLLRSPLEPAELTTTLPPDAGTNSGLAAKVFEAVPPASNVFRILLVSGPKDHGPDEHDYPLWQKRWAKLLGLAEKVEVAATSDWPSAGEMERADVMVLYSNNPGWNKARAAELASFQERGGGLVYVHYAVDGHQDVEALSGRIGLAWRGGASKFRHGSLDLKLAEHPITKGFPNLQLHDESYWQLTGDVKRVTVLASGVEDGKEQPLMWTRENGKGRVFVSIPGHYTWTFDDPAFRLVLLRGICWAGHQPLERLSELAFVGARQGK